MDRSLDDLMWLIADEGDHTAVDAFIKRHPEHRAELIKRVNMVRDMRGAKPQEVSTGAPAKFRPTGEVRRLTSRPAPTLRWAAAGASMLAIGWASFFAVSQFTKPAREPEVVVTMNAEKAAPNTDTAPTYGDPNANVVPPSQPPPASKSPGERAFSIESEGIDLITLLNLITQQTQLRIELGPGIENATISARYLSLPAISVLRDLGQKLNFTVFEQEPGHVLLIPAVDPNVIEAPPTQTQRDSAEETLTKPELSQGRDGQLPELAPN